MYRLVTTTRSCLLTGYSTYASRKSLHSDRCCRYVGSSILMRINDANKCTQYLALKVTLVVWAWKRRIKLYTSWGCEFQKLMMAV